MPGGLPGVDVASRVLVCCGAPGAPLVRLCHAVVLGRREEASSGRPQRHVLPVGEVGRGAAEHATDEVGLPVRTGLDQDLIELIAGGADRDPA
jgi:hypothetical protein